MLRTIAVWNRSLYVTVPLVVASLGQWSVLLYNVSTVRGGWSDHFSKCLLDAFPPMRLESVYLYSTVLMLQQSNKPLMIFVEYSDVI